MMLLIDNYDSFTYNLAHLFGALGVDVTVRRNDEIDAAEAERLAPSQLVVSPGPGRPADAGGGEGGRIAGEIRRQREAGGQREERKERELLHGLEPA